MSNPWVAHIKEFAKKHNLSYGCALSNPECKNTYKSKKVTSTTKNVTSTTPVEKYDKRKHLEAIKTHNEEKYIMSLTAPTTTSTKPRTREEIEKDRKESAKHSHEISTAKRRAASNRNVSKKEQALLDKMEKEFFEKQLALPPKPNIEYNFSDVVKKKKKSGVLL